ncbi:MAG: ankyrin repeat domain-containing protein, partial [Promethearchaeia archaeon]
SMQDAVREALPHGTSVWDTAHNTAVYGGGGLIFSPFTPNTAQDEAALRIAAHNGDVQTLNKMLKANVDINATNPGGSSALHLAARAGQDDIVKLLLAEERCATNVPDKTHGETPLHEAVFWGHVECCRKLLEAKADPNTENRSGQTPRDLAEDMRFENVLQVLRDDGRSNPADRGQHPRRRAQTEGDRLTVDELVALMKSWKEVGDDENKFCARQLELGKSSSSSSSHKRTHAHTHSTHIHTYTHAHAHTHTCERHRSGTRHGCAGLCWPRRQRDFWRGYGGPSQGDETRMASSVSRSRGG